MRGFRSAMTASADVTPGSYRGGHVDRPVAVHAPDRREAPTHRRGRSCQQLQTNQVEGLTRRVEEQHPARWYAGPWSSGRTPRCMRNLFAMNNLHVWRRTPVTHSVDNFEPDSITPYKTTWVGCGRLADRDRAQTEIPARRVAFPPFARRGVVDLAIPAAPRRVMPARSWPPSLARRRQLGLASVSQTERLLSHRFLTSVTCRQRS